MVARAGGYYGEAITGAHGVTQRDPLSSTIFNVVVDAVTRHWVSLMVEGPEERGMIGQEGRHQNTLFYTEDDMVASLEPQWLQGAFSPSVGLFYRLGLQTNVIKTVCMVCCPCQAVGTQLEVV